MVAPRNTVFWNCQDKVTSKWSRPTRRWPIEVACFRMCKARISRLRPGDTHTYIYICVSERPLKTVFEFTQPAQMLVIIPIYNDIIAWSTGVCCNWRVNALRDVRVVWAMKLIVVCVHVRICIYMYILHFALKEQDSWYIHEYRSYSIFMFPYIYITLISLCVRLIWKVLRYYIW